jgi:hypothetical protein
LNGIVAAMPSPHTERPISDDLSSAAEKKSRPAEIAVPHTTVSPDAPAALPRYLLPKDLPGALAQLDDREIDSLLAAVIEEATRRGRLTPTLKAKLVEASQGADPPPKTQTPVRAPASPLQGTHIDRTASLTIGQTNAVRAAFMAGVKPSAIARQFGISQSVVRKTLSSGTHRPKR